MAETRNVSRVAEGGRIVIPARFRKALRLKTGDSVILQLENQEVRLYSRAEALRRAQDRVARAVPRGKSLAAELITERRREAVRD